MLIGRDRRRSSRQQSIRRAPRLRQARPAAVCALTVTVPSVCGRCCVTFCISSSDANCIDQTLTNKREQEMERWKLTGSLCSLIFSSFFFFYSRHDVYRPKGLTYRKCVTCINTVTAVQGTSALYSHQTYSIRGKYN